MPARFQHSCCPVPTRRSRGCNITPCPLPGSRSPRTQQKTLLVPARGHHGHNKRRSSFQLAVSTNAAKNTVGSGSRSPRALLKTQLVPARGHHGLQQNAAGSNLRSPYPAPAEPVAATKRLQPQVRGARTGRRKAATTPRRCWNQATETLCGEMFCTHRQHVLLEPAKQKS